ncbi:hypothetical protein CC86DRAFT_423217, partial [Ophiobolus disseminans]
HHLTKCNAGSLHCPNPICSRSRCKTCLRHTPVNVILSRHAHDYLGMSLVCADCQSVLERPFKPMNPFDIDMDPAYIECNEATLLQTASNGCQICRRFVQMLASLPHQRPGMHSFAKELSINQKCLPDGYLLCLVLPDDLLPIEGMCILVAPTLQHAGQTWLGEDNEVNLVTLLPMNSTRDPYCFKRVENWMNDCLQNHKHCSTPINPFHGNQTHLPARLLSVDVIAPILSHRWKQNEVLKLTTANLGGMRDAIPLSL